MKLTDYVRVMEQRLEAGHSLVCVECGELLIYEPDDYCSKCR